MEWNTRKKMSNEFQNIVTCDESIYFCDFNHELEILPNQFYNQGKI